MPPTSAQGPGSVMGDQKLEERLEVLEAELDKMRKALAEQKTHQEEMEKVQLELEKKVKVGEPKPKPPEKKGTTLCLGSQFFIKMMSPKLVHFDKPLLVAVAIFIMTAAIGAILVWVLSHCTTSEAFKTGATTDHILHVVSKRKAGISLCLLDSNYWGLPPMRNAGFQQLQQSSCMLSESLVSGWLATDVDGIVSSEDMVHATEGLVWCDGAQQVAVSACEKTHGGTCPPCASVRNGTAPDNSVYSLVFYETSCPSPLVTIGVLLGCIHKVELLVTLITVVTLLATGVIHQYGDNNELIDFKAAAKTDIESAAALPSDSP